MTLPKRKRRTIRLKDEIDGLNIAYTVGHNRTLELQAGEGFNVAIGRLHGHQIFRVTRIHFDEQQPDRCTLNHQDYMTVTTRSAMNDFMRGFGIAGGVSFAKGEFSARINGRDYAALEGQRTLTFSVYS